MSVDMTPIELCAGIVLIHGVPPKALMIRVRSSGYELPKGHLEGQETAQEAAVRELREETGLMSEVCLGKHLGTLEYSFEKGAGIMHKQVQYFLCQAIEPLMFGKRPSRTKELRWISKDELAGLRLVSENLRPLLQKAFN